MRTTLTLDDDVAAKLEAEARKLGKPFKQVVNSLLRLAFTMRQSEDKPKPFHVEAYDLRLRPGLDYNNIGDLLEQLEGPTHR
jgi:hypothetical protein